MILKFQSGKTWIVFGELDHVEYEYLGRKDETVGYGYPIICFPPPDDNVLTPAIQEYDIRFFTKGMNEGKQIHAFSPIYLMNDQGRTVETI